MDRVDEFDTELAAAVAEHEAAGPRVYDPATGCYLFPTGAVADLDGGG